MSAITTNGVQSTRRSPARFFRAMAGRFRRLSAAGLWRAQEPLEIAIAEAQRQRSQSRVPKDPSQHLAAEQRHEEMRRSVDRLLLM